MKASHVDPEVNKEFAKWCEEQYGNEELGHIKVNNDKRIDYLGMIMDFSEEGILKLDMKYYIQSMLDEFPVQLKPIMTTPWTDKFFKVNKKSKKLDAERRAILHTFVMKGLFLAKRARPDIAPGIAFLTSRVDVATEEDWNKLRALCFCFVELE